MPTAGRAGASASPMLHLRFHTFDKGLGARETRHCPLSRSTFGWLPGRSCASTHLLQVCSQAWVVASVRGQRDGMRPLGHHRLRRCVQVNGAVGRRDYDHPADATMPSALNAGQKSREEKRRNESRAEKRREEKALPVLCPGRTLTRRTAYVACSIPPGCLERILSGGG